jgi:transcriptional regulator with XRE-family HTH domain
VVFCASHIFSAQDGKSFQDILLGTFMSLKAQFLLKANVDALLRARGQTRKELATYCRRSESWISQIFTKRDRNIPLKYLDRMADFFGIATYQLFQPGITPLTERRRVADRRSGVDRRLSRGGDVLQPVPSLADLESRVRQLSPEEYRRFVRRAFGALALVDQPRDLGLPRGPAETGGTPTGPIRRIRSRRPQEDDEA